MNCRREPVSGLDSLESSVIGLDPGLVTEPAVLFGEALEEFSKPDFDAVSNGVRQSFFDNLTDGIRMLAGAEVRNDDHFILEQIGPGDNIFEVRVAEFM